jgi:hypothetical protein
MIVSAPNALSQRYSVLKSGTSPNFLITVASLKSPVAGSPVRENATAPTRPRLSRKSFGTHDGRIGVEAFGRLASRDAIVGNDEW